MWRHSWVTVIVVFAIIGITDAVDGFIARRYQATSRLGAYLDPIADKVFLSGSFLVLALVGAIPAWLAIVVLGRDALILLAAGVLYLAKSRRNFPPSVWGKVSTLAQILFVCFRVGVLAGVRVAMVAQGLEWAVVILVFASFADYARRSTQHSSSEPA